MYFTEKVTFAPILTLINLIMKRFSAIAFLALAAAFVITSCNKDNSYSRKLDGEWTLKSMTIDGQAVELGDDFSQTQKLNKCKSSKEWCSGEATTTFGSTTETSTFQWKITDKGMYMLTRNDENDTDADTTKIVEISGKEASFESMDGSQKWTVEKK